MKNVNRLKERAPEYAKKLAFSMVMDPSNDYDCINEITVASEDMNDHTFIASIVDRDYDEDSVAYSEEYSWKYQYQLFLALLSMVGRYPEKEVSAISRGAIGRLSNDMEHLQISGPLHLTDVPSGPCIPGQLRLFVSVEEKLFPCERVSESSGVTCIGTLDTGIDIPKARELLNVGAITNEACRNCWGFRHCTVCAKKADNNGEFLSPQFKLSHCKEIRASAYTKLRQLLLLQEVDLYYTKQIRGTGSVVQ